MTDETTRERLHRLVDALPERDLELARRILELVAGRPGDARRSPRRPSRGCATCSGS